MGHAEARTDAPDTIDSVEVFRAPRVSLIARPEFLEPAHLAVKWRGEASDGERLAEYAGRLCYMSQHNPVNRTTAEYLENIKKQGHGSVLEHPVYVLLIEGISRSCSHELVRRRGIDAALRAGDRQSPPAEAGARSGAQRVAQRHGSEDRRLRQRARVAHDARAPLWRRRGAGNPPHGDRRAPSSPKSSWYALLRFRDLHCRRQTRSRSRHVSQSLVQRFSFDDFLSTSFFNFSLLRI